MCSDGDNPKCLYDKMPGSFNDYFMLIYINRKKIYIYISTENSNQIIISA